MISNDAELLQFCQTIKDANCIALDTEFMRTRTFYAYLALIQVFDGKQLALIDPLSIKDWQPFISILQNKAIDKYFHACSEDIDVLLHQFDFVPEPILDSQILASFLDNPISAGYASLVNKYLGVELDKSETRTDWLQRPLSDKQCQYAANDVFYLLPLMMKLKALLFDKGWLNAALEECQNAIKRRCKPLPVEEVYLQIKNAWQLNSVQLGQLKKLATWRFNYAQEHNIALNFVIHSDLIWKLARYQPRSLSELSALGLRGKEIRLYGHRLLKLLAEPVENLPTIKRIVNYPDYKKWSSLIKNTANEISQQTQLSTDLLVSRRQIEQFIRWIYQEDTEEPELLTGWRGKLFKNHLIMPS